jgi:hypothetical protein
MQKTVNYQVDVPVPLNDDLEFNVNFEEDRFSQDYELEPSKPAETTKKGALKKSTFSKPQPTTVAQTLAL